MREGYKKTEIGVIPLDWEVVELGSCIEGKGTYGIGASAVDYDENLLTYLRITDIDDNGKFITINNKCVDSPKASNYILKKGDIVFARTGNTTGKTYQYNPNDGILVYAGFLIKFTPNKELLDTYYLKLQAETSRYWNWVKVTSLRTGQPGINSEEYSKFLIPLPPLTQQKKIAQILSTADEKIEAIALQIEKAEMVKKGLLQKLLSEGIGHSEFKESELGMIPEDWEVVELATIVTILLSNVDKKSKENEQNVKLCNYMDVYNNQYITNDLMYMSATAKDAQIEKFQLQINDVIITKDSETKDDIAIPAVVIETFDNLLCGYHLAILRPNKNILYGVYLMNAIESTNVHRYFEKLANGITRFGLTSATLNKALIPLPPLKEQTKIANILTTADEKLEVLRAKKAKYEELKVGLMQKLLSGEVRV